MVSVQDGRVGSVSEYLTLEAEFVLGANGTAGNIPTGGHRKLLVPERPAVCLGCGAAMSFWVHSYYFRWAVEGDVKVKIPVPRYMCWLCHLVVSVLWAFLVPYRLFTVQAMAAGVEGYVSTETTYRSLASELASGKDDSHRPNHSQVWRWVDLFARKSAKTLGVVLQRACMRAGKESRLTGVSELKCPNSRKAHSLEKFKRLNDARRVLALADISLDCRSNLVQALQTYFGTFVQAPLSILTGRGIRLLTPQSSQPMIF